MRHISSVAELVINNAGNMELRGAIHFVNGSAAE